MEPIVLVGAMIVIFGLWQEAGPVLQRITRAISNSCIMLKLTSALTGQTPSYQTHTWLERRKSPHYEGLFFKCR